MISPQTNYSTSNIIYIRGGIEGAKNYPVTPGYTAWMIDEENRQFFIKTIGANGVPNIREFDYSEKSPQMQASSVEPSKYATKEDIDKLYQELRKLQDKRNNHKYNNNYRRNYGNGKSHGKTV